MSEEKRDSSMRRVASPPLAAVASALIVALTVAPGVVSSARAQQRGAQRAARPAAFVYAVESRGGETTVDPILGLGARGQVLDAGGGMDDDALKGFAAEHFKPGRRLRLIFGGGEAGSLTVKSSKAGDECFRTGARVELETTAARVGGNVMALATDSATLGRRAASRRAPTDAERAAVEKLARSLLARRRLTPAQLRDLHTVNLTATDLDGDGTFELAGTFKAARGKGAAEQLFLLAEARGADFAAAVSNAHPLRAADLPNPEALDAAGPGGFLSEIFLDQLDLDGDGAGELFTYGQSFEGAQYTVYKKTRGRWQKLREFSVYRCAY